MLVSFMEKNKAILRDREFKFKLDDFSGSLNKDGCKLFTTPPIQGWSIWATCEYFDCKTWLCLFWAQPLRTLETFAFSLLEVLL